MEMEKKNKSRFLFKDSSGKYSWTITFCVLASLLIILWFTVWLIDDDIKGLKLAAGLVKNFALMTIGALIARTTVNQINAGFSKNGNGNGNNKIKEDPKEPPL